MTKATVVKSDENELIHHVITACNYLVRWGSRLTSSESTTATRCHSTDQRVEAVAATLEPTTGFVARDWRGLCANWQCWASLAPANVSGLSSASSPQGNAMLKSQDDATRAVNLAA